MCNRAIQPARRARSRRRRRRRRSLFSLQATEQQRTLRFHSNTKCLLGSRKVNAPYILMLQAWPYKQATCEGKNLNWKAKSACPPPPRVLHNATPESSWLVQCGTDVKQASDRPTNYPLSVSLSQGKPREEAK